MNTTLLVAFGLMLVLEGILPLIAPQVWKQTFQKMIELKDGQLRFVGLLSMLIGFVLIMIVR